MIGYFAELLFPAIEIPNERILFYLVQKKIQNANNLRLSPGLILVVMFLVKLDFVLRA